MVLQVKGVVMLSKREVYDGYQEAYMTGCEIKTFLSDAYSTFGRHHSRISSTRIKVDAFSKLKDDEKFRVFHNEDFIKIMDGETDKEIYFIGYTKTRPDWAKD